MHRRSKQEHPSDHLTQTQCEVGSFFAPWQPHDDCVGTDPWLPWWLGHGRGGSHRGRNGSTYQNTLVNIQLIAAALNAPLSYTRYTCSHHPTARHAFVNDASPQRLIVACRTEPRIFIIWLLNKCLDGKRRSLKIPFKSSGRVTADCGTFPGKGLGP